MIVQHIIEDLKSVLTSTPEASSFEVAFASYIDDDFEQIEFKSIEAFNWDEDEEFFLVPTGIAKYYDLEENIYSAETFLNQLKNIENTSVLNFVTFARARTKIAKDGSVASLNSPLWGTGIHEADKLIYFYHGKQPE
jgi:hypothetical protein